MRVRKQSDQKECGPLVVQAMHEHFFDKKINLNNIKANAEMGSNGINIINMIKLLNYYGIEADAYNAPAELIKRNEVGYAIALVSSNGMSHYVILKAMRRGFKIFDSIKGTYFLSMEKFNEIYQGSILVLEKGEYTPEEIDITHPLRYLARNWNLIIWIVISIVLSIAFTFIAPLYMKIIIDKIIPSKLSSTLTILSLSFAFLAILRAFNRFLRSYLVKKLSLQIEKDLSYTYFEKICGSSFKDVSKITNNDNLRRISMISHVSGFIANSFFVIFNEFTMLIVSMSLLIWISPNLFSISLSAAGLIILSTASFRLLSRTKYDELINSQMDLFNSYVDTTEQIMEIKNPYAYKFNKRNFSKRLDRARKIDFNLWSFNSVQALIEMIIMFASPILIVYFGSRNIFNNEITMGSLIMFVAIFNSFIDPVKDLADFILKLPQMGKNIDLISFIINLKDESLNENGLKLDSIKSISFRNALIGYDKNIIELKDFKIKSSIHLVGKNGSGKSTLLNAISTILPIKGKMMFNEFEKDYYDLVNVRENIAMVNPLTYIPNISVLEYITLGDKKAAKTFNNNMKKIRNSKFIDKCGTFPWHYAYK